MDELHLTNQNSPLIAQDKSAAKPLAHQAIHDTVVQILENSPRGALLDVPAGEGALAESLLNLGFDVRCCDLYPEIFRLHGIEVSRGNLTETLPYPDGAFDYITCIEGLEHIETPHQAIREFRRLLRAGGHLIISIPNILNIEERFKLLLYGYSSHFKPLSREGLTRLRDECDGKVEVAAHINPIGYPELRYILEKNDFTVLRLYRDRPKTHLWAYRPIVSLIRWLNRRQPEHKQRERWSAELHSDEVLLGGNTLIVHAMKEV
jgi:SAM-dependent methyltransferase